MKMDDKEIGFLRLLMRSPDIGDGWRKVSSVVWPLVDGFKRPELIESEGSRENGGRVRLSERGAVVVYYV